MGKEEHEKYDFDKSDDVDKEYDGNWENPPIPKGKRIVFEVF